jgi:hypothetical protein
MESSKLTRWAGPAPAWAAAFIVCVAADVLLGRWVLLPVCVVGFYGGMLIMASLIYPLLEQWRCCSCGQLIRYLVDKPVHDTFACEGETGSRLSAFSAGYVDGRGFLLTLARFIANSLACTPILSF